MKYILFIFFGVCIIGGLGLAVYVALIPPIQTTPAPTSFSDMSSSNSFSTSSTSLQKTFRVPTKDGGSLDVYDFRDAHMSQMITLDTNSSTMQYYVLSLGDSTAGYSIAYFVDSHTFVLTLTKEPFRDTQKEAESALQRGLRVAPSDVCLLDVAVSFVQKGVEVERVSELSMCKKI